MTTRLVNTNRVSYEGVMNSLDSYLSCLMLTVKLGFMLGITTTTTRTEDGLRQW